jgi:putative glycerol-1-phosphate prenyltransferase
MNSVVYNQLCEANKKKNTLIAVLIDPEKYQPEKFKKIVPLINKYADILFIGGSYTTQRQTEAAIYEAKKQCKKPIVLFPGPSMKPHKDADAILLLSLISGRNPDLLIGRHVENAFELKESSIEIIPTGYLLIESGKTTSVSYLSQTHPLPADKPPLIAATALAGQQLGLKCIYLEAGSGAKNIVPISIIKYLKEILDIPLIVGGGINTVEKAKKIAQTGIPLLVLGNALENNPNFIKSVYQSLKR